MNPSRVPALRGGHSLPLAMYVTMDLIAGHDPDARSDASLTNGRSAPSSRESPPASQDFLLAAWHVRPSQNRLTRGGEEIALEPKAMDVLVQLAAARGESVSRDTLLSTVWPDVFVTDDSLHRAVSRLRRALAASDELGDVVITVPKRGYRLDPAQLSFALDEPGAANESAPPDARSRWLTSPLAVLGGFALCAAMVAIVAVSTRPPAIDLSGLRSTPFTGYPGQERAAAFSPDGSAAVFAWSGEAGDNWDLYVKAVGEWEPARLTTHADADFNAAWSPDGGTIAFLRIGGEGGCRILTMPAGGGEATLLRPCNARGDVDLAWSPDGTALYLTDRVGRSGPLAVHRLELATNAERQVTFPPADYWGDTLVRVSPDGDEIAFARTRALGVTDVYVAGINGIDERALTDDRLKVHGLDWSADGERLFFSSNRGGTFGLWSIGVGGGKPQPLMAGVNADSVAVARNGGKLLFETETTATSLQRLALGVEADAAPTAITQASGWDWHPVLSADGTRIAFVSDRSGSPELWLAGADGSMPSKITNFGGPYANSPAWSADGTRLLLTVPFDGNFDIYAVDAASGDIEQLTNHPASDRNPAFSADGRQVYFGSNRTGQWEIWRLDTTTQATEQVTTNGGFRAQATADGQIFYVKRELPGLFAVPANGSGDEERLVTGKLLPLDHANWQVTGDYVHFIARDNDTSASLRQVDLATGLETASRPLPGFPFYSGLAIAADGSYALYASIDVIEADLVLLEGFGG